MKKQDGKKISVSAEGIYRQLSEAERVELEKRRIAYISKLDKLCEDAAKEVPISSKCEILRDEIALKANVSVGLSSFHATITLYLKGSDFYQDRKYDHHISVQYLSDKDKWVAKWSDYVVIKAKAKTSGKAIDKLTKKLVRHQKEMVPSGF